MVMCRARLMVTPRSRSSFRFWRKPFAPRWTSCQSTASWSSPLCLPLVCISTHTHEHYAHEFRLHIYMYMSTRTQSYHFSTPFAPRWMSCQSTASWSSPLCQPLVCISTHTHLHNIFVYMSTRTIVSLPGRAARVRRLAAPHRAYHCYALITCMCIAILQHCCV